MKHTNTLIIGQGIAGSLIAFMLNRYNISFIVVDPGYANTASRVAAGMFTPISGKRRTIDTVMLQQIPFAIDTYKQIENLLHKDILHLQNIYQSPVSLEEQNDLFKKSTSDVFEKFIIQHPEKLPHIKQDFDAFEITNSGWIDCALFINSFKDWLIQNDTLIQEEFNYSSLIINKETLQYNELEFEKIIFCEGYRAIDNPFFKDETIIPCKGDVLTIECKNNFTGNIVKRDGCYLIPQTNNLFKAGSTYQWNNSDENLIETDKKEIENKLDAMLENKYTIINHQTAIRPTTQNREVIAKQHQKYPGMFMLNGLGTKGIIQGPYWAKYIVELIMKST